MILKLCAYALYCASVGREEGQLCGFGVYCRFHGICVSAERHLLIVQVAEKEVATTAVEVVVVGSGQRAAGS